MSVSKFQTFTTLFYNIFIIIIRNVGVNFPMNKFAPLNFNVKICKPLSTFEKKVNIKCQYLDSETQYQGPYSTF